MASFFCCLCLEATSFLFSVPWPELFKRTITLSTAMINHHPVGKAIGFPNNYPLDSDLSGRKRYPAFEQPEPGARGAGKTAGLGADFWSVLGFFVHITSHKNIGRCEERFKRSRRTFNLQTMFCPQLRTNLISVSKIRQCMEGRALK